MTQKRGNASSIGTATHTEYHYPPSTSKSKKRSKTKCIYYDPAPKECMKVHIGCPGTTNCKYYCEKSPSPIPAHLPFVNEKTPASKSTPPAVPVSGVKEGVVVLHKTFGHGTVTRINVLENSIYVSFSGDEKRFQFPAAFSNGYLELQRKEQPKKAHREPTNNSTVANSIADNSLNANTSPDIGRSSASEPPSVNEASRDTEKIIPQVEAPKRRIAMNLPIICGVGLAILILAFLRYLIGN